jgi:hypothetical protein
MSLVSITREGAIMSFDIFWEMYPRKVSKRVAQRKFESLKPDEQSMALEALPNHIKYWKSKNTEMEFICHASTWLSQYRFEDEIVIEQPKVNKRPELPWYSSEELTIKKAQEIGVQAYAGEGWQQWRARISNKIKQLEEQA